MNIPHSTALTDDQQRYRRELLLSIFKLLSSNGQNARPVYIKLTKLPKGGLQELIKTRPYDAVRADIGGTTLTVEVTTDKQGEQNDPDALRYACYDLEDFQDWFFKILSKAGMPLRPPANVSGDVVRNFTTFYPSTPIRADLRSAPMFHKKKKGGKQ